MPEAPVGSPSEYFYTSTILDFLKKFLFSRLMLLAAPQAKILQFKNLILLEMPTFRAHLRQTNNITSLVRAYTPRSFFLRRHNFHTFSPPKSKKNLPTRPNRNPSYCCPHDQKRKNEKKMSENLKF